jgi:hypothetical protein
MSVSSRKATVSRPDRSHGEVGPALGVELRIGSRTFAQVVHEAERLTAQPPVFRDIDEHRDLFTVFCHDLRDLE